jgi:hypothetical protein
LTHTVAERIEADHDAFSASRPVFDARNFDEPVPSAPIIPYSFDEAIERYRLLFNQSAIPHVARGAHPITQKFMAEDERLAQLAKTSSWYQPKFTSPEGKALLDGINRLLWFFHDLGFAPRSSGQRYIVIWVGRGRHGHNFEVAPIESHSVTGRRKSSAPAGRFGFWYDIQQWERASAKPLRRFSRFRSSHGTHFVASPYWSLSGWRRTFATVCSVITSGTCRNASARSRKPRQHANGSVRDCLPKKRPSARQETTC